MKKLQLQKLTVAFKEGFYAGAIISFMVYVFARILFYEFTFTAWEEVSNFFLIIVSGGLMVSAAIISFLLLETGLKYLLNLRVSFASLSVTRIRFAEDMPVGLIEDMQTAA